MGKLVVTLHFPITWSRSRLPLPTSLQRHYLSWGEHLEWRHTSKWLSVTPAVTKRCRTLELELRINDASSDRIPEEEGFFCHNYWFQPCSACLCRRRINSDGSESCANGCVTADGSVNHKCLSSHYHKPEAGRGCQPDTVRRNADKYNDQQPVTVCNQHKQQLNPLRSADVTGDPNSAMCCW